MKPTAATRVIMFLFRCVPLGLRRHLFTSFFLLFYYFSPRQRLIALHNLCRAYPDKDIGELAGIAKGVFRHVGTVAAEFFELPKITRENLHEWVEFDGLENFNNALALNKGILSVVAHFGNWELMTVALPLAAQPMGIIYRPLDSPVLDDMLAWMRTLHGNTLIPKEGAMKKIVRLLRENQAIGILSDQNVAAREGVFVEFFGRPACTAVGTAVLAMRTGAPVLPAFMPRIAKGKYRFVIKPPVEITVTGDDEADILVNTQRFTRVVEEMVRQYPDQWFWIHQRWKTQPFQKE
ncbi:MAG: lysophospholipid acyltransferase family protein [Syntrophales bacterium]